MDRVGGIEDERQSRGRTADSAESSLWHRVEGKEGNGGVGCWVPGIFLFLFCFFEIEGRSLSHTFLCSSQRKGARLDMETRLGNKNCPHQEKPRTLAFQLSANIRDGIGFSTWKMKEF